VKGNYKKSSSGSGAGSITYDVSNIYSVVLGLRASIVSSGFGAFEVVEAALFLLANLLTGEPTEMRCG
jgi:hypothetical protein